MLTVYGITNCNTVKKARTWLEAHQIAYEFHDYKKLGIDKEKLQSWIGQVGWEALVNKKGMTWRGLDEATKNSITNADAAIGLMMAKTSVIKRPLMEKDNQKVLALGFDEAEYQSIWG